MNKKERAIGRSRRRERERRWNTPKKVRNISLLSLSLSINLHVLEYEYVYYLYIYIYLLFQCIMFVSLFFFSFWMSGLFVLQQDEESLSLQRTPTEKTETLVRRWQNGIYTERKTRKGFCKKIFGPSPLSIIIGSSPECNFDFGVHIKSLNLFF